MASERYQLRSFNDDDLGESIELTVRRRNLRVGAAFLAVGFVPMAVILLGGRAGPHAPALATAFYFLPFWVLYVVVWAWEVTGEIRRRVGLPVRLVVGSDGFRLECLRSSDTVSWSQVRSIECGSPKAVFPSFQQSRSIEIELVEPHGQRPRRRVIRLSQPWPKAESVRLLLEKTRAGEDPTIAARVLKP